MRPICPFCGLPRHPRRIVRLICALTGGRIFCP